MAGYLWTTGALFALITVAHILRMFAEPHFARDPGYLALTAAAAALSVWAGRLLLRSSPRSARRA
jgi:hypothetical protein